MPITYEIDAALGLITLQHSGDVAIADMRSTSERMFGDGAVKPEYRVLILMNSARFHFTADEVRAHRKWRKHGQKAPQMAIVAESDYAFGLARMYDLTMDNASAEQVRVFRDAASARQWLGLP